MKGSSAGARWVYNNKYKEFTPKDRKDINDKPKDRRVVFSCWSPAPKDKIKA